MAGLRGDPHRRDLCRRARRPKPLPPIRVDEPTIVDDLRRQHLALRRAGRAIRHLAPDPGAPGPGDADATCRSGSRRPASPDCFTRVRARRAAAGHPDRDDAARGLRDGGLQARGHHQEVDGAVHEPMESLVDRLPRGVHRRGHPEAGAAQGAHDEDGQSRDGAGAAGVPHPLARPDRLPLGVPDRHAGHRHAEPPVRRLRRLAGADHRPRTTGALVADRPGRRHRLRHRAPPGPRG